MTDASPLLHWTDDGEPRSARFGDVYFSKDDGLAESRAVFLTGCGLPDAWAGRRRFTVAELGFGTGLNIAALLELWRAHRPENGRLHIFSIEGFPLSRDEAARALSAWPELAEPVAALLDAWPAGTPGFHRIDLPGFDAVIDLAIGDAAWALSEWQGRADAWFLDGFSPALNPGMWSEAVMDGIAARSAPGARLATFTVAGGVRRGLAERGFVVDKRPGHGRKRERLEARLPGDPAPEIMPRVAIVGAGVAGAATTRALIVQGVRPTVIEADRPGAGGSGFPAALVTPRLDAGDATIAGLYAQALERAGQLYEATPDAVIARGVLQLSEAQRDGRRFGKIAAQSLWPTGDMTVADADAATAWTGEPQGGGGLAMAGARVVHPAAILDDWLAGADRVSGEVVQIERRGDGWRLLDADGVVLVEADVVVVTAGWGSAALLEGVAHPLPLSPVRGQADWTTNPMTTQGTAWGGYAAPTRGGGLLFGATHDRGDTAVDSRQVDTDRNLATLAARLPRLAQAIKDGGEIQQRAAIRATTPDRLPVAGQMAPDLHVLSGLGSRGFCAAPLLGEHIAAVITGAPSPLAASSAARIAPGRF